MAARPAVEQTSLVAAKVVLVVTVAMVRPPFLTVVTVALAAWGVQAASVQAVAKVAQGAWRVPTAMPVVATLAMVVMLVSQRVKVPTVTVITAVVARVLADPSLFAQAVIC